MTSATCRVMLGDLDLSGIDSGGASWRASVEEFDGWDGSPGSSAQSTQRPADHGGWSTDPYLTPRAIGVGGTVAAPDHAGLHAAFRRLIAAATLGESTFRVAEDDGIVRVAQVRRGGDVMTQALTSNRGRWSISLVADDPLRYSEAVRMATAELPNVSGGWSPPMTFPFTIGAVVTPNQVAVFNGGDEPALPLIQIHGPVTNPILQVPETGREMRFQISLGTGDYLTIDCAAGSVVLNDSVSRMNTLLSASFLEFPPGTSSMRYAGGSYDPASFATATWRDTWQ